MPNWVSNDVNINGTEEEITRFREFVKGIEEPFSFNSILPMPVILEGTSSPPHVFDTQEEVDAHDDKHKDLPTVGRAITKDQLAVIEETTEYTDWYDWRCDEWGTKWDVHEVEFEDGVDVLTYSFDTAWDAPCGVFDKLVEEFPTLHISWFYSEESEEFEGYLFHYQGKQMGDVKFLDLDNDNELEIFDLIVNDAVDIQRCQFEGEETKCPMFELADDPRNDRDCSKQKWEGFKSFCELLPEKTTYRENEYENEETN